MSFGDAWGFGADEKQSHRILGEFAEAGGNFVDTANAYHEGQSGGDPRQLPSQPRPLGGGDQVHPGQAARRP